MKKRVMPWAIGFVYCLFCSCVLASDAKSLDSGTSCRSLKIGISMSIPPWVIKETDQGIELDLLRAALSTERYCVEPNYLSFALAFQLFEKGKLDGVINATEDIEEGYLSQPVVTFQNVAVSLTEKGYPLDIGIDYLIDKSVVAFQKASSFLGDDFSAMSKKNAEYLEVADQKLQLNLLFIRGVDFIVLDHSIFQYHRLDALSNNKLVRYRTSFKRPVTVHSLFPSSPYPFLFKDESVRDDFDHGLAELRKSGEYESIVNKYSDLLAPLDRDMH